MKESKNKFQTEIERSLQKTFNSENVENKSNDTELLKVYAMRAFPNLDIKEIFINNTHSALNSVFFVANILNNNNITEKYFIKIPIDSTLNTLDSNLAHTEYRNSLKLAELGWPVVKPIYESKDDNLPAIIFPYIEDQSLFEKLKETNNIGISTLTSDDLLGFENYLNTSADIGLATLSRYTTDLAVTSPIQKVFYDRYKRGGRIDKWFSDETTFNLPGLNSEIEWKHLKKLKWVINDEIFNTDLHSIIENSKDSFSFKDVKDTSLFMSHGDDHSANLFTKNPVISYDCAFSGLNPVSLEVKSLANIGFLLQAGMYYQPEGINMNYQVDGDIIKVDHNIDQLPLNDVCEILAEKIINIRTLPTFRKLIENDEPLENELNRMKCALSACALSQINISEALRQNSGRAIGLLPIAVMLYELRGLPMLNYLSTELNYLR